MQFLRCIFFDTQHLTWAAFRPARDLEALECGEIYPFETALAQFGYETVTSASNADRANRRQADTEVRASKPLQGK